MTQRGRAVTVKQLPDKFDGRRERMFFRELEGSMNVERPAIVLDCTGLHVMSKSAIHLLLCCLEGAMKRNGDVRLAGLSSEAMASLRHSGADRIFRVFNTNDEAVESFQRRIAHTGMHPHTSCAELASEHAA